MDVELIGNFFRINQGMLRILGNCDRAEPRPLILFLSRCLFFNLVRHHHKTWSMIGGDPDNSLLRGITLAPVRSTSTSSQLMHIARPP